MPNDHDVGCPFLQIPWRLWPRTTSSWWGSKFDVEFDVDPDTEQKQEIAGRHIAVSQKFETLRNPNPKVKDYVKGCQFLMTPTLL